MAINDVNKKNMLMEDMYRYVLYCHRGIGTIHQTVLTLDKLDHRLDWVVFSINITL